MTTNTCIICFNRLNSALPSSPSSSPSSPSGRASSPVDTSPVAHINCIHLFHLSCLQLWTEVSTTCPYCRTPFDTIHISDTVEGEISRSLSVEKKEQAPENLDDLFGDAELPNEYCQVCQLGEDEGIMIECNMCTDFYHINCLTPPLPVPPQTAWYCESCAEIRAFSGLSSQSSSTATTFRPRRRRRQQQSQSITRPRSTPTLITNLYSRTPSRTRPNSLLSRIRREVNRQRELREPISSLPESARNTYPGHTRGNSSIVQFDRVGRKSGKSSRLFTNPAMDMRTAMGAKVDESVWNMVNARTGLDRVFGKGSYSRGLEDVTEEEEEEGENIWKELEMAKKLKDREISEAKPKGVVASGENELRFKRSSSFKPAIPNSQAIASFGAASTLDSALKRSTQPVAKSASANVPPIFDFYASFTLQSNRKRKFSSRDMGSESSSPHGSANSSSLMRSEGATTVKLPPILDRSSISIERKKQVSNTHKSFGKDKEVITQGEIKPRKKLFALSYDYTSSPSSLNPEDATGLDLFSIIKADDNNTRNASGKGKISYVDETLGKGNEIATKTNSSNFQNFKSLSSNYRIPKKTIYSNTLSNPEPNATILPSDGTNHNVILASDSSDLNNDNASPPASSSLSSLHSIIATNIKHTIATHVAAKLRPYYHTGKITRDEFKSINKKVTHYLYNRTPGLFEVGENTGVVTSNEERNALVQRIVDKYITKSLSL